MFVLLTLSLHLASLLVAGLGLSSDLGLLTFNRTPPPLATPLFSFLVSMPQLIDLGCPILVFMNKSLSVTDKSINNDFRVGCFGRA